jgi:membrane protein DedA with SNARE-associated domain
MTVVGPSTVLRVGVLALRIRHHVRGPRGDYLGLAGAAVASWAGVPGPGEAALVTAGVLASRHKLDIVSVVAVAWLGATAGGIAGWLIGLKAGRAVVTARGPLRRARLSIVDRGDRFFERYGAIAVFFTPSWVAGVHGMRWTRYLPANAVAGLAWALVVGLGSFAVGPSITDVVDDIGLAGTLVLVALLVAALVLARRRRSRRGTQHERRDPR